MNITCLLLLVTIHLSIAAKRKCKPDDTPGVNDIEIYRSRTLQDWQALSKQALDLIVAELHLEPHGTREQLAVRIYDELHPRNPPEAASTSRVLEQENTEQASRNLPTVGTENDMQGQFVSLRDELYTVIAQQIAGLSHELSQQITSRDSQGRSQGPSQFINPQVAQQQDAAPQVVLSSTTPSQTLSNTNIVPDTNSNQLNVPASLPSNNFRFPAISSTNINLIQNGKYVNLDTLLPSSLSHPTSGYSIHVS